MLSASRPVEPEGGVRGNKERNLIDNSFNQKEIKKCCSVIAPSLMVAAGDSSLMRQLTAVGSCDSWKLGREGGQDDLLDEGDG